MIKLTYAALSLSLVAMLGACGDEEGIDSDEEARRAYFGLDASMEKSLELGFAGFNAASSANIDAQAAAGIVGGVLTITGQVDQGASANKGMRLRVGMVDYNNGDLVIEGETLEVDITYNTSLDPALQPALTLSLKNIPTGTLDGTLVGTYSMSGDLEGEAELNLTFAGQLQDNGTGGVIRMPGTTTVTGTATTGDGSYEVNLTL